jgi:phage head maturation protease
MAKARMIGQITKVEDMGDGTRMVSGIASTPTKDSDGESFTGDCLRGAIPDYMAKRRAVREMHDPQKAAGVTTEMYVDDDDVTHITAHVVDPVTVLKVDTGVLKMFSIQGNVPPGGRDANDRKIIHKLKLREVSLVDVGANPDCDVTEVVKLDGDEGDDVEVETDVTTAAAGAPVEAATDTAVKVETPTGDTVKKGLYGVSRFAELLASLGYQAQDASYEAQYEGDNSPLPEQMRAWLASGAEILKAMTEEETSELLASLAPPDPAPVVEVIALADSKPGADAVEKKGAKFSAATKGKLAEAHDHIQKAADCMKASGYDDSAKAETAVEGEDTIAKVAGLEDSVSKLSTERDALKDTVTKLQSEAKQHEAQLDEIVKGMKAKGFLRVVEKGNDDNVGKADAGVEAEPSDPLDAIRKIHKSGGVTIQPRA